MTYVKITAELVVKLSAQDKVIGELNQALDLIREDNIIYYDDIEAHVTSKPDNAEDFDVGENNDE